MVMNMKKTFLSIPVSFIVLALCACTISYENDGSAVVLYDDNSAQQSSMCAEGNTEFDYCESSNNINLSISSNSIPKYNGSPYIEINGNVPLFTEYTTDVFEEYSDLDSLGRCGAAFANVCKEIMPTEERGQIGNVKPSGWHTVKYNGIISGNYLYNRCHLIGYQLAGENANEKNLITGTRYLNVTGMLPFENEVAECAESGYHIMYRVTPIFDGDNLVADGVLIEAYSVEDSGSSVKFCVFCYNVQPGIGIDYSNGNSWVE